MKILSSLAAFTLCASALGMFHPHIPRTETLELDKKIGKIEISHITVPYNPAHMEKIPQGFVYHLGFAKLTVPCELKSGAVKIPKGEYSLNAKYLGDGGWSMALYPGALSREVAMLGFAMLDGKQDGVARAKANLEAAAKKASVSTQPIEVPMTVAEQDPPTEHLAIHIQVADANKEREAEGFALWVEFGSLKATAHLTWGDGVKPAAKEN